MKIAIIYDWMDSWGGVERLLLTLNELLPEADWYTSYVDKEEATWTEKIQKESSLPAGRQVDGARDDRIRTSFIQKLPPFIRKNRILSLPFYPFAFESFDLSGFDLVISVTSSFAKGVITRPETKHVCILLTPTRWLWGQEHSYELGVTSYELVKPIKNRFIRYLKKWDYIAAQRPDQMISISQTVARRCKTYYDRDSQVIYPPFDTSYWKQIRQEKWEDRALVEQIFEEMNPYYLVVSRLEPYKRIDLVVEAFNAMKENNLVIVGKGTEQMKLMEKAGDNIVFVEDVSDRELAEIYTHAEALIMPQEEDFGYVSLEAQFFGCPVIAYAKGGAAETVIDGKTGILFQEQSSGSLRDAVERYDRGQYNLEGSHGICNQFSKEKFINTINSVLHYL